MSSARKYISSAAQGALAVYLALHERPLVGATPTELAATLDISRDQAFRALHNLAHRDLACRTGGGSAAWRLTRRAATLSERMRDALMATHLNGDAP